MHTNTMKNAAGSNCEKIKICNESILLGKVTENEKKKSDEINIRN